MTAIIYLIGKPRTGIPQILQKLVSQISGEPAQRILIREHRRIPKFDMPNLEVSKV